MKPMNDKFSWTQEYVKSWDKKIEEVQDISFQRINNYNPYKKNIIRHLHICIDSSEAIEKSDYLPTIRNKINNVMGGFINHFNAMNPLSVLSYSLNSDVFQKYTKSFSASTFLNMIGEKSFSLVNCLESVVEVFKNSSYNRECLMIISAISTKDNGSLNSVLDEIKRLNIKIHIISISGEVTVFKNVCAITNGLFYVPVNAEHFEMILKSFGDAHESIETTNNLIRLGFPEMSGNMGVCCCHLMFQEDLYECPSCGAYVCSLPVWCPICSMQLVSSTSIVRCYWSMYPLEPYSVDENGTCRMCSEESKERCNECNNCFCGKCASYMHQDLGFCVFCK